MQKYIVVNRFKDLQDENYIYEINDTYPRKKCKNKPNNQRIEELITGKNENGKVYIQKIEKQNTQETKSTKREENE